jgi:hypothetical protein
MVVFDIATRFVRNSNRKLQRLSSWEALDWDWKENAWQVHKRKKKGGTGVEGEEEKEGESGDRGTGEKEESTGERRPGQKGVRREGRGREGGENTFGKEMRRKGWRMVRYSPSSKFEVNFFFRPRCACCQNHNQYRQ